MSSFVASVLFHRCPAVPVQAQSPPEPDARGRAASLHRDRPACEHSGRSVAATARRQAARQSPTFRRQWQTIGAARIVRVSLISTPVLRERRRRAPAPGSRATPSAPSAPWSSCRAPSTSPSCCRTSSSTCIEQIEGLDLPALAKDGRAGRATRWRAASTKPSAPGTPASDAMREVYGETDRQSRRRCAACNAPSGPCFPTDESPPTRRRSPTRRPVAAPAAGRREPSIP